MAGWVMMDLVSPRLVAMLSTRVLSMTWKAAARACFGGARRAGRTTAPRRLAPIAVRMASSCCGCEASAGVVHPCHLPAGCSSQRATCSVASLCAFMRSVERLHALEHHPGVERRQRHPRGAHHRPEDIDG